MATEFWDDLFGALDQAAPEEWVQRIQSLIPKDASIISFSDGAKTMAHLLFAQSKKTNQELLKKSAVYALVSGIGYLTGRRVVSAVGMATWLREEFKDHLAGQALNQAIVMARKTPDNAHGHGPDNARIIQPSESQPTIVEGTRDQLHLQLFAGFPDEELSRLLGGAKWRRYSLGSSILKKGDRADRFFVIVSGEVEIVLESGQTHVVRDQDFFGEMAMLLGKKEVNAGARAKTDVEVLEFTKLQLVEAFVQYPDLETRILRDVFLRCLLNVAKGIKGLERYSAVELSEFLMGFTPKAFKVNQKLFQKGDLAHGLYLIMDGEVSIEVDGKQIASIRPGQFIGEISLLEKSLHTADAVPTTGVHALVCAPEDFQALSKRFPRFQQFVKEVATQRIKKLKELLAS